MTRRIKDRTEWLAFLTACVLSRLAVIPLSCRTTATGATIQTPAIVIILVAGITSLLAVRLVYFLEAKHTNDPCVRRHRLWDMTEIVTFMVVWESVSVWCAASPLWLRLTLITLVMAALFWGKLRLQRRFTPESPALGPAKLPPIP